MSTAAHLSVGEFERQVAHRVAEYEPYRRRDGVAAVQLARLGS